MIEWHWYEPHGLSVAQWYAVMSARVSVFVVEQKCAYQELDGWDLRASHLVGWSGTDVAAYLRCFAPGVKYTEASIGRILTTQTFRSGGVGRELVVRGLARIDTDFPGAPVRIGAQAHLERFYSAFGFKTVSAPYDEDGIPHIDMVRTGANSHPR